MISKWNWKYEWKRKRNWKTKWDINIVEKILVFNDWTQRLKELKILTPDQMLSRLPIILAQLKVRNNSEKLKNEIRQLSHSLYRSKTSTKTIYNRLINTI